MFKEWAELKKNKPNVAATLLMYHRCKDFQICHFQLLVDTDISSAYKDDDSKCTSFSLVIYSSSAYAFICSRDFCLFLVRLVD